MEATSQARPPSLARLLEATPIKQPSHLSCAVFILESIEEHPEVRELGPNKGSVFLVRKTLLGGWGALGLSANRKGRLCHVFAVANHAEDTVATVQARVYKGLITYVLSQLAYLGLLIYVKNNLINCHIIILRSAAFEIFFYKFD